MASINQHLIAVRRSRPVPARANERVQFKARTQRRDITRKNIDTHDTEVYDMEDNRTASAEKHPVEAASTAQTWALRCCRPARDMSCPMGTPDDRRHAGAGQRLQLSSRVGDEPQPKQGEGRLHELRRAGRGHRRCLLSERPDQSRCHDRRDPASRRRCCRVQLCLLQGRARLFRRPGTLRICLLRAGPLLLDHDAAVPLPCVDRRGWAACMRRYT